MENMLQNTSAAFLFVGHSPAIPNKYVKGYCGELNKSDFVFKLLTSLGSKEPMRLRQPVCFKLTGWPKLLGPGGNAYLLLKLEQLLLAGVSLCTHLLILLQVFILRGGQQVFAFCFPLGLQLSLY